MPKQAVPKHILFNDILKPGHKYKVELTINCPIYISSTELDKRGTTIEDHLKLQDPVQSVNNLFKEQPPVLTKADNYITNTFNNVNIKVPDQRIIEVVQTCNFELPINILEFCFKD